MKIKATEMLLLDDMHNVIELSKQFHEECEQGIAFNEKITYMNFLRVLKDIERTTSNVWVVYRDNEAIGWAYGFISDILFSEDKEASLVYWYVVPKHRKSRAAFELLHTFQNWAKLSGAKRIIVGAGRVDHEEANSINKMFVNRGLARYGSTFYSDIKDK